MQLIRLLNTKEPNFVSQVMKHLDLSCLADLMYKFVTSPDSDENAAAIKRVGDA